MYNILLLILYLEENIIFNTSKDPFWTKFLPKYLSDKLAQKHYPCNKPRCVVYKILLTSTPLRKQKLLGNFSVFASILSEPWNIIYQLANFEKKD